MKFIGTGLILAGSMMLTGVSHAADIKERTLKFAFVQMMDNHWGAGAKKFADVVSEKSGGKIKIRLYPNGVLGGDIQTISALQGGTLDISMMGAGVLVGVVKEYVLFDLPFLFNSPQEADAALDGPPGQKLLAKLPEKGLVGLSYWEHGFRSLTNSRKPVEKWEDIQGLKIRVIQAPLYLDLFNTVGANAVPMPLPELYTALETGTVDGQENPLVSIESSKFYEVQKYLSTTRHVYNPLLVMFSKKTWDKLSEDERKLMQEAADEVKPYQRQVHRDMEAKVLATLKGHGMTVTEVSEAERERMREKVKPVTEKYTREAGEELVNEMYAEIEKVRSQH
jgi:tripartite ATP-independent transporter DctP family solute receptor